MSANQGEVKRIDLQCPSVNEGGVRCVLMIGHVEYKHLYPVTVGTIETTEPGQ